MSPAEEALQQVEFDATLEERIEVHERVAMRSATMRRQRLSNRIAIAAVYGALAFFLFRMLVRRNDAPFWQTTLLALCTAAVGFVLAGPLLRRSHRRLVRRFLVEGSGAGPIRCVIALHRDCLRSHQAGIDFSFAWRDLEKIDEEGGDVVLWFRPGVIVVRARAFAAAAERQRFVELARRLHAAGAAPASQPATAH